MPLVPLTSHYKRMWHSGVSKTSFGYGNVIYKAAYQQLNQLLAIIY